ncbi:MAG: hypothetical protein JEZ11_07105 [Desulfobacterales bacterium]|nr:hypothetical protein [Desulfobacterales bacterium]
MEPTIEEAMAWVKEHNPDAAKVIQNALDNRIVVQAGIPEPDPPAGSE